MIKLKVKVGVVIGLMVFLASCKISPPISVDYDTSYDYSKLRSYAWVVGKDPSKVTTLDNRRQTNAIETILNRKGFTKLGESSSSSNADFLLRTHTLTDKKVDVDTFYNIWGYYPYYYHPYGWPGRSSTTIVREYEVGTLVLDIVDPKKKEVIWRGSVSRKLGVYKNRTPEERASIALTNAEFLLESFPPGSSGQSSASK